MDIILLISIYALLLNGDFVWSLSSCEQVTRCFQYYFDSHAHEEMMCLCVFVQVHTWLPTLSFLPNARCSSDFTAYIWLFPCPKSILGLIDTKVLGFFKWKKLGGSFI